MVTKLPPVSIGIPFFNAERFLMDAIKSVFAQSHQDWELILMDDGSTDRSLEIARSIQDPRVRVYSDGSNRKLAARLNEIHRLAGHDFIARMDADDLMATDRIEKQLRVLMAQPGFDLVTTGVCSITDNSVPYGVRVTEPGHVLTPFSVLSGQHGIVHASLLGRKSWFLRNPYDPTDHWAEDYKLWVRSCIKRDLSVGFIREPLYFYREEGSANAEKMLSGQRMGREVIRANGREMVGPTRTATLMGKSMLKSFAIGVASVSGLTRQLVRLRSPKISQDDLRSVQAHIELIASLNILASTCAD